MRNIKLCISAALVLMSVFFQATVIAQPAKIEVELTLPDLNVQPYHRPYLAVWLETPDRKYVTTLALWVQKAEWFKDLRQWWRKAGRTNTDFDGISGATKRAGTYTIKWDGNDKKGNPVSPGKYLLNIEVVREEGGRDYTRIALDLTQPEKITIDGKNEFSTSFVTVSAQ